MLAPVYFKPWIKEQQWLIKLLLFFLLMTGLVQFALYGLLQSYVLGALGAQPEDISFSTQITYAALIASIPIQARLLRYFQIRQYLQTMLMLSIIISIVFLYIDNIYVFLLMRLPLGFIVSGIAISCLTLILSRLQPFEIVIGFSVFYGSILGAGLLSGTLVYRVTDDMNWENVYLYLILVQALAIIFVLLSLHRNSGQRRYPLYQLEWQSFILALTLYIAIAFTFIYGPRYYWTDDPRVRASILIALCTLALLIYRQGIIKRPYLHPDVFKHKPFIIGILLLAVYYGVKDSINLVYAYTLNVLRWDTGKLIWLSSCNVLGLVTFMIISTQLLLSKKIRIPYFFLIGFTLLLIYHVWMYRIFSTDLSFGDLAGPVILQGAASGMLFVPIIVFMVAQLPPYTGFTGAALGSFIRFQATINGIAGFYTLQLHYNQQYKEGFLQHLTTLDDPFIQRLGQYATVFRAAGYTPEQSNMLATASVSRALTVQSQLLTNLAVFKIMSVIIVCMLILLITVPLLLRLVRSIRSKRSTA